MPDATATGAVVCLRDLAMICVYGRLCGAAVAALLLVSVSARAASGVDLNAWQEITVLTVSRIEAAATNCGFQINGQRLQLLLDSAGLTLAQVHGLPRSEALARQIGAASAASRGNRDAACAAAWDLFGADGQARDYLKR